MFGQLLLIVVGVLAFIGAGTFSYYSAKQTIGNIEVAQQAVAPVSDVGRLIQNKISTPTSTIAVAKKPAIKTPTHTNNVLVPAPVVVEKVVVAPEPLRVPTSATAVVSPSALSVSGVLVHTNSARAQNGALSALAKSEILDRVAKEKLDDMFAKQYFEHVSPSGVGPADLAKTAGYQYVIVGENLALGNFESDEKLVDAWMASPGHRANILNAHYQEIGIAVGKGVYEGRETWLAVQSFGMPSSACPATDTAQKVLIESNNVEIARMRGELDAQKTQIENTSPYDSSYNTLVGEFNALVSSYNALAEVTRSLVEAYNAGVRAFNACIEGVQGH